MAGVALRAATVDEIARIYCPPEAEHIIAEVGGEAVAWIGFRKIEGRLWGMFGMLTAAAPSVCVHLFWQFRKRLHQKTEPVVVLANDAQAMRLLRLLGLKPTEETYAGKQVWVWTPEK